MATEELRTSSVVRVHVELVIDPVLAELAVQVAQVELEALAGLEDQVVPAVRAALVVRENRVAPVGLAVQAAPVGLANRVAPVGLAVQAAPAALGLVQVAAVAQELDRVEPQRRIRSATAAHHRGQVPVPRVEDLAEEVVETTREPAVIEAAAAWAAAG
jgi:hypothetical protein